MEKEKKAKQNVFKKLLKKEIIISLVIGLVLGIIIMFFANGGIEGLSSGKLITKGDLYNRMKNYFSIELVLEDVDKTILNKKYKLTEDEINDLKETADGYIEQYEMYGYTKEDFLSENGFEDYDTFVDYLGLDYRRTRYIYDYLETKLEKDAVKTYYDEHAFGKVNTKHILVKTSDTMNDEQAQNLAKEIITKLNEGSNFDTLATEYTTNYADSVITEDLGENGAFDNLEEGYVNGMKELEAGKYSTEPVKTSYGYHVIYCVDKTEKTDEISGKDKIAIVQILADEEGITLDQETYYKALIQMREDAGLKFFDKDFKTKYEKYCEPYVEVEEETEGGNEIEHNHSEGEQEISKEEVSTEIEIPLDTEE